MSKKRYITEQQVLDDMAKITVKALELQVLADQNEDLLHRLSGSKEDWRCDELCKEVHRLRVKATNLIDKKLPILGDKLSTLRTPVLVATDGEDGSVPA
jgi:hypothetical protein